MTRENARRVAIAFGAVLALLLVTQLLLPGAGGGARGTPAAILFRGALNGLVASLTAAGLVLIYRSVRVINFAQVALGVPGGVVAFDLIQYTRVPFAVALLLGLATSAVVGFAIGVIALRFSRAPRLVLTVFTTFLTVVAAGAAQFLTRLPYLPPIEAREVTDLDPGFFRAKLPLAGFDFSVGSLEIRFTFGDVLAAELALVALVCLGLFFRRTRSGIAVRGLAENTERAALLGIGVPWLTIVVWTLAAALAGMGVTLTGVLTTPQVAEGFAPELLVPALAAAVLARMRNIPVTVTAAVAIGVLDQAWAWSFRDHDGLFDAILFGVVAVALFVQRRELTRSEQQVDTSAWQASLEPRPVPRELLALRSVRFARWALIGAGIAVLVLYPFVMSVGATNLGGVIALNTIVVLSLVVLTGWAGQVSLGQYALVAVGSVVGGALSSRVGIPGGFWTAVPIATLVATLVALVIGLPALRIRGLFLLVVTFAFAVAVSQTLFQERYFGWLLPKEVKRPTLFVIDFDDERSMYFLCVAALIASIAFVTSIRRNRVGRIFIALRDNEANVSAFGVNAVRARLLAFAISGGLAGFAGAIFAHHQRGISAESFTPAANLAAFVAAVFGGVSSVTGALLGATYFNVVEYMVTGDFLLLLFGPLAALLLMYAAPGGLVSLLHMARDSALRIVAQRRQILTPGLFVDVDADVHAAQLAPLHDPLPSGGLKALPAGVRFSLESKLLPEAGEGDERRDEDAVLVSTVAQLAGVSSEER